ncbi:hypothetical protein HDV63DRAFT_176644 [Trichoderma sp. SZMC 28014]
MRSKRGELCLVFGGVAANQTAQSRLRFLLQLQLLPKGSISGSQRSSHACRPSSLFNIPPPAFRNQPPRGTPICLFLLLLLRTGKQDPDFASARAVLCAVRWLPTNPTCPVWANHPEATWPHLQHTSKAPDKTQKVPAQGNECHWEARRRLWHKQC